ncbi:MAG: DUF4298 domain-containing protein [Muribaculaceae bacterium]|nr:DUF4298 domain-containing protein [Muribaculaceae bacterium]
MRKKHSGPVAQADSSMSGISVQTERIKAMEARLNRGVAVAADMEQALLQFGTIQEDLKALEQYLGSEERKQDLAADEAGLLPDGLKRGVLSEDGIWNLLERVKDIKSQFKDLSQT